MLTCSIDNFYGFLEIVEMRFVRFVDMFYEFLCLIDWIDIFNDI